MAEEWVEAYLYRKNGNSTVVQILSLPFCKNCIFHFETGYCDKHAIYTDDNFFCGSGVKNDG